MYLLFFVFVFGVVGAVPLHFVSVGHTKLQARYGTDNGVKIGEAYGRLSGYLLFFSMIGIWVSPQPRFTVRVLPKVLLLFPFINLSIPLTHLIIFLFGFLPGFFLLYHSVSDLSRKVSEAHQPEKVVSTGIYARVRHPQYLSFILLHIGFSFLFSGLYALLATPLVFLMLYAFARKEEAELVKEFGNDYEEYKKEVPMFIPR